MMYEENKAIVRRYLAGLSKGDLDIVDRLISSNFVPHNPAVVGSPPGRQGQKQIISSLRSAFPDLTFTIKDIIAEGDKVAVRWKARGTHKGEWMGKAPTGKEITLSTIIFYRISAGKIVELWSTVDTTSILRQI